MLVEEGAEREKNEESERKSRVTNVLAKKE
jgi:hypothetical protein